MGIITFERFQLDKHLLDLPKKGKILVAPLNWGLGHATRCVPIIEQLIAFGFEVIMASDGSALLFLQKRFPDIKSYELPSYQITYAKHSFFFHWKMAMQLPHLFKTIKGEQQKINEIVINEKIDGIISDNRFGVKHPSIPNVFISHQLKILSGITGLLSSKWHQKIINSFDVIWIPDVEGLPNLSGDLSHDVPLKIPKRYIGLLSSHHKEDLEKKYDLLILLSGPEPLRTQLEKKVRHKYQTSDQNICLVRGIIEPEIQQKRLGNLTLYNFSFGKHLQDLFNSSDLIIARSGYSTLMDLALLEKKAILIPTPGQPEQIYLGKHVSNLKLWEVIKQKNF